MQEQFEKDVPSTKKPQPPSLEKVGGWAGLHKDMWGEVLGYLSTADFVHLLLLTNKQLTEKIKDHYKTQILGLFTENKFALWQKLFVKCESETVVSYFKNLNIYQNDYSTILTHHLKTSEFSNLRKDIKLIISPLLQTIFIRNKEKTAIIGFNSNKQLSPAQQMQILWFSERITQLEIKLHKFIFEHLKDKYNRSTTDLDDLEKSAKYLPTSILTQAINNHFKNKYFSSNPQLTGLDVKLLQIAPPQHFSSIDIKANEKQIQAILVAIKAEKLSLSTLTFEQIFTFVSLSAQNAKSVLRLKKLFSNLKWEDQEKIYSKIIEFKKLEIDQIFKKESKNCSITGLVENIKKLDALEIEVSKLVSYNDQPSHKQQQLCIDSILEKRKEFTTELAQKIKAFKKYESSENMLFPVVFLEVMALAAFFVGLIFTAGPLIFIGLGLIGLSMLIIMVPGLFLIGRIARNTSGDKDSVNQTELLEAENLLEKLYITSPLNPLSAPVTADAPAGPSQNDNGTTYNKSPVSEAVAALAPASPNFPASSNQNNTSEDLDAQASNEINNAPNYQN